MLCESTDDFLIQVHHSSSPSSFKLPASQESRHALTLYKKRCETLESVRWKQMWYLVFRSLNHLQVTRYKKAPSDTSDDGGSAEKCQGGQDDHKPCLNKRKTNLNNVTSWRQRTLLISNVKKERKQSKGTNPEEANFIDKACTFLGKI